jgi:hypothetical protein
MRRLRGVERALRVDSVCAGASECSFAPITEALQPSSFLSKTSWLRLPLLHYLFTARILCVFNPSVKAHLEDTKRTSGTP